jgi:hypothetical protein
VQLVAFVTTYNGLSTGPFISCCTDFLSEGIPDLGQTIQEIELYPHCSSRGRSLKTLDSMRERFQDRLKNTLPLAGVYRKSHRAFVSYKSSWCYSNSVFDKQTCFPKLGVFNMLCQEMVLAVNLLSRKIKVQDDFNLPALCTHLQKRLTEIPTNEKNLSKLQQYYHHLRDQNDSQKQV